MPKQEGIWVWTLGVAVILLLILVIVVRAYNVKQSQGVPKVIKHSKDGYDLYEIHNLLSQDECDKIVAYAKTKGLHDSDVLSYGSSTGTIVMDEYRKSKTAWIADNEHALAMKMAELSQNLTSLPRENQEMLQIAYYEPGGKFNEHFDACVSEDTTGEFCKKMNNFAGQRRCTLLVYLNDNFKGGETEFVNMGIKVKPEKGKGILFWNTDENENILEMSKHKGNPVTKGEKWICTKWSHVSKYS